MTTRRARFIALAALAASPLLLTPTAAAGAPPKANADLAITGSHAPDSVALGEELTYTFRVSNGGPATAKAVTFSDTIPAEVDWVSTTSSQGSCSGDRAIRCSLGHLVAGGAADVVVVVRPNTSGTITNTASVDASEPDPDSTNNAVSVTTEVVDPTPVAGADVEVTFVGGSGRGTFLGRAYVVKLLATVQNNGPSTATSIRVRLAGAANVVAASDRGVCTGNTCTLPTLAPGETATVHGVGTHTTTYTGHYPGDFGYAHASAFAVEHDPNRWNNERYGFMFYSATPDRLPDVCGKLCF